METGLGSGATHRKREEEKKWDTDPQLRFIDNFRDFFNPEFQVDYKMSYGREICIQFHSKDECVRNCLQNHALLHSHVRADCICLLVHCSAGYKSNAYTKK